MRGWRRRQAATAASRAGPRAAGIGVGDDRARLVEAGLLTDAEHPAMLRHDAARKLQVGKTLARARQWRREHVGEGIADHADHGRHLRHVGNPFRPHPVAGEQHQRSQAIQHPGQPLPAHIGIDHHEAEMGDLRRLAVEDDVHHRQRVEGDRLAAVFFRDQRDDGARQSLLVAGEDAVGQALLGQRLGSDDAKL
jgi:hypothetical protein